MLIPRHLPDIKTSGISILKKGSALAFSLFVGCSALNASDSTKPSFGGIYPHLAYYNNEGECGTGAVVPWQGKLWVITYGPHMAFGSSDKLYEIDDTLGITTRPESTGGTPADRMIHRESDQLIIGPYFIDNSGTVRTISYKTAPGRYTGVARHLSDPGSRVYIATMEEGFYDIDVNSLQTTIVYPDGNGLPSEAPGVNPQNNLLPGCHGKGLYSGQGVLVFANNGEATREALEKFNVPSGVLAEWNGKDWKVIRRNQFTEITGPGGIYGNENPEDPIYALGWDYKSVLLGLREKGEWHFFRLPKASNSYDGAHGWNTEWPRIRDIGTPGNPFKLMTMHGMFWHFPENFSTSKTSGIRPLSSYLKVIGDFARWNGKVVLGCDDTAQKEFLNKRRIKGEMAGPGQSNSNLWFINQEELDSFGPTNSTGAVWLNEQVEAKVPSEPLLFGHWPKRCAWLKNNSGHPVVITIETESGDGKWKQLRKVNIDPYTAEFVPFTDKDKGEWVRLVSNATAKLDAIFSFSDNDDRNTEPDALFNGLATVGNRSMNPGQLYSLGNNRRSLGILSDGKYYELDGDMTLKSVNDSATASFISKNLSPTRHGISVENGSVLIIDDKGRRWRLPLGDKSFTGIIDNNLARICREVSTERDLLNCHGTFYELPAENADGFAKIRPIASHDFMINDYCSYRGLLMMSGVANPSPGNNRLITSDDKRLTLWAGCIDDLWKMGKPRGHGGPWLDAKVAPGEYSDPYLIGFYDKKDLAITHDSPRQVTITLEADPTGEGNWMTYTSIKAKPGETFHYSFPDEFQARWIRFKSDTGCTISTVLDYK